MTISLIEHSNVYPMPLNILHFSITGISRACLQEVVRHNFGFSVESTRYTLNKKLKNEPSFLPLEDNEDRLAKYLCRTGHKDIDKAAAETLERIRELATQNISGDLLKYALGEAFLVDLMLTTDVPTLANFFRLRSSSAALWEIRELSHAMYNVLPEYYQVYFKPTSEYLSTIDKSTRTAIKVDNNRWRVI